MKKTYFEAFDLDIYYEKISNGLEIYVLPMKKFSSVYATFTTKYGSIHNNFRFKGEKEYKKMPAGIAHFLEHKVFESENGIDVFDVFHKNGARPNANTSHVRTCYLFKTNEKPLENLDFLLNYVQEPYFTDENVKKEKGIIVEEAKMYHNINDYYISDVVMNNLFHKSEYKIPIIGTIDSINSITKDQLKECYNTFYNPSNMVVIVTGDVEPKETIDLIKSNQSKKSFPSIPEIELFKEEELDSVFKEKEFLDLDLENDTVSLSYKISLKEILSDGFEVDILNWYIYGLLFSKTSDLNEVLDEKNLTIGGYSSGFFRADDFLIINVDFKTDKDAEMVVNIIDEVVKNVEITKADFDRKKQKMKMVLATYPMNVNTPNNFILSDVVNNGFLNYNVLNDLENFNYDDFIKYYSKLSLENKAVVIAKKKA